MIEFNRLLWYDVDDEDHGGRNVAHSDLKRARPMTSRSQTVETGLKLDTLMLFEAMLLTDDEREAEALLLRNRSPSSTSSSATEPAFSAVIAGEGNALLFGESDSHFS